MHRHRQKPPRPSPAALSEFSAAKRGIRCKAGFRIPEFKLREAPPLCTRLPTLQGARIRGATFSSAAASGYCCPESRCRFQKHFSASRPLQSFRALELQNGQVYTKAPPSLQKVAPETARQDWSHGMGLVAEWDWSLQSGGPAAKWGGASPSLTRRRHARGAGGRRPPASLHSRAPSAATEIVE